VACLAATPLTLKDQGKRAVTFGTDNHAFDARAGDESLAATAVEATIEARAQRLLKLVKARDTHFRRAIMADTAMATMLALFLAEIRSVPLNETTLSMVTLLDGDGAQQTIETLIHAGLAVVTGENPERRTVGLTPLGSARMRSYIMDHPDL